MISEHPYIKYGQALIMSEYNLSDYTQITPKHLIDEIEKCLLTFRVKPVSNNFISKTKVKFNYIGQGKANRKNNLFLSPHIISADKESPKLWVATDKILEYLKGISKEKNKDGTWEKIIIPVDLNKDIKVSKAICPISGEFIGSNLGRSQPKHTLLENALSLITTITPDKPSLAYVTKVKGQNSYTNSCIIPDLPINDMINFIEVFKNMKISGLSQDVMYGHIYELEKNKKKTLEVKRPLIFDGNFPNSSKSNSLFDISLLGVLGDYSSHSTNAKKLLDKLKNTPLYIFEYGDGKYIKYDNHIVDLSKECKLNKIINSCYKTELYKGLRFKDTKTFNSDIEYKNFDIFLGEFIKNFDSRTFQRFLSFKGEYYNNTEILFNIYFYKMEKIDKEIINSVKELGKWVNQVAYFAATQELEQRKVLNTDEKYWEKLRKTKIKLLLNIESGVLSAQTNDEFIKQIIMRVSRLSNYDVPESCELFIDSLLCGDLSLDNAKNMIVSYSRIKDIKPKTDNTDKKDTDKKDTDKKDLSNI